MNVDYKFILPGDRELKIRCEDFARKNVKAIAGIASSKGYRSRASYKEILQACHMCGIIYGEHWHDNECPSSAGTNFSDSMFVLDEDLTQFSYSLFKLMGGKF